MKDKKTPEVLPWIPPGIDKDETHNKFAHKKGSIASQINAAVAAKKGSISSRKPSDSGAAQILSLSDSGRGSTFTTYEKPPKAKIIEILEEDENNYESQDNPRVVDTTSDSGVGSLGESKTKKPSRDKERKKERKTRRSYSDSEGDDEEEDLDVEYRRQKRKEGLKPQEEGENGKLRRKISTPNTAEMRGYSAMRKSLDGDGLNISLGDSLNSRNSISYYNRDGNRQFDRGRHQSFRNWDNNPNQSFQSKNLEFISPRYNNNNQQLDSLDVNRLRQGDVPEAWLVFPGEKSRLGDYPSPRGHVFGPDYPSPRGGGVVPEYPSPRGQGRFSRAAQPVGVARAVPVNFGNSIASRLQASFANIKTVRSSPSMTPVETFVEDDDTEKLIDRKSGKGCPTWVWIVLVCILLVVLVAIILGIVFGVTGAGSSSSSLVLVSGPGDNRPCKDYIALTESWRRIVGQGPSETGGKYHCDKTIIEETWYRFEGEAGERLADHSDPPSWEECGTSRVGWLAGRHPDISDGTVNRTLCITAFEGNCEVKMEGGQVRGCPDSRGGMFFVYLLRKPSVGCNWGYCAVG